MISSNSEVEAKKIAAKQLYETLQKATEEAISINRKLKKDFNINAKELGGKNDKISLVANLIE